MFFMRIGTPRRLRTYGDRTGVISMLISPPLSVPEMTIEGEQTGAATGWYDNNSERHMACFMMFTLTATAAVVGRPAVCCRCLAFNDGCWVGKRRRRRHGVLVSERRLPHRPQRLQHYVAVLS